MATTTPLLELETNQKAGENRNLRKLVLVRSLMLPDRALRAWML